MPKQMQLFENEEPIRAERLQQSMDVEIRNRVITLLAEMGCATLSTRCETVQEGEGDES